MMDKAFIDTNIKEKQRAEEIGLILAARLQHPQHVKNTVTLSNNITMGGHHPWDDFSLASGYPSMIMLFGTLDKKYPNHGWDLIAHEYMLALKASLEKREINGSSLFGGLGGIAYAVYTISKEGQRYTKFLHSINSLLQHETQKLLEAVNHIIEQGKGVPCIAYDVIAGIVGIGRYLLETRDMEENRTLLLDVLHTLCGLAKPIVISEVNVPGWYCSKEYQFNETYRDKYPNGNFNLGVSHGIAGVLALLSLCLEKGIKVPGMVSVMEQIIDCLVYFKQEDEAGIYWPGIISFEEYTASSLENVQIADTWCYGSAGIGRVLFLAGRATGREDLKVLSRRVYHSIYNDRTMSQRNLAGSSFCHGTAGLLYLTGKMGLDTSDDYLMDASKEIFERLNNQFNADSPFGYDDTEGHLTVNKPGLLEGTAGIALALVSLYDSKKFCWNQLFLID